MNFHQYSWTESSTDPRIDRGSWGMIVYRFRREGLSSRKKISFGVVAMATWLELSIYKLVFCILPLANISFSPHLSLASLYLSFCLKHTITLPLILSNSLGIESTPPLILLGSSSKLQCFGIIQDPKTSVLLKWHRYVVSNFTTTSPGVFCRNHHHILSVNLYMKYLHRIVQTSTSVTGLVCLVSN